MTCFVVRLAQAFVEEYFTQGRKSDVLVFHTIKLKVLPVSGFRKVNL